jgi:hypothetical protein
LERRKTGSSLSLATSREDGGADQPVIMKIEVKYRIRHEGIELELGVHDLPEDLGRQLSPNGHGQQPH